MNSTPPASHLYCTLVSETCCCRQVSVKIKHCQDQRPDLGDFFPQPRSALGVFSMFFYRLVEDDVSQGKLSAIFIQYAVDKGLVSKGSLTSVFLLIPDHASVGNVWMHEKMSFKFGGCYLVSSNFEYFLRVGRQIHPPR